LGKETITILANTGMCTPDLGYNGWSVLPAHELFSCVLIDFQLLLYRKCTQPSVMTAVTNGRQGPAPHVNNSLAQSKRDISVKVDWHDS
jgi:hypothetical protein